MAVVAVMDEAATVRVILDPHVQTAIFCIGGAVIAALVLLILILADMTPIKKDDTDNDFHPPFA